MTSAQSPTNTAAPPAARRGILYVKWGPVDKLLERSLHSVRAIHPELPIHVHQLPENATRLDKPVMFDVTPFEETLYLDVDTVVLDRLDFGFNMAIRYALACCICECPWARRYGAIKGDVVEYNTGVLFFTRAARRYFEGWQKHVRTIDSSCWFPRLGELPLMPYNDQAGFALAVAESNVPPFILPFNWNFRPQWHRAWFGPIKIWHDKAEPLQRIIDFVEQQANPESHIRYARITDGQ